MRLAHQVAVITGAGAGIGEAIALRFAREGARLILNDLTEEAAESIAARCREFSPAVGLAADVSRPETGELLAARARTEFGGAGILVNNAADFTQMAVEQAGVADWQRVLGVNLIGPAMLCKAFLEQLAERGGNVVNISSQSGVIAQENFATYNSSKAGLNMLTRCLALDWAPHGIRVNAVCPGLIHTAASDREVERLGIPFDEWRAKGTARQMIKRLGTPDEIASAVLFLASGEASFITGATLMVDGGRTAW